MSYTTIEKYEIDGNRYTIQRHEYRQDRPYWVMVPTGVIGQVDTLEAARNLIEAKAVWSLASGIEAQSKRVAEMAQALAVLEHGNIASLKVD